MARTGQTDTQNIQSGQLLPRQPTLGRVRVKLDTLAGVRRELCSLYRAMKSGQIPTSDGSRLAFVLGMVAKLDVDIGFDERLRQLEQRNGEKDRP